MADNWRELLRGPTFESQLNDAWADLQKMNAENFGKAMSSLSSAAQKTGMTIAELAESMKTLAAAGISPPLVGEVTGRCPWCLELIPIDKSGRLVRHGVPPYCSGSHGLPAESLDAGRAKPKPSIPTPAEPSPFPLAPRRSIELPD